MENLKESINKIIKWGISDSEFYIKNKIEILLHQLIELNYLFSKLNFNENFDDDYQESPEFNYEEIRKIVSKNFPDFGYYNSALNIAENIGEPEFSVGDSIDDLSDIIKDLLEVKWHFENSTVNIALESLYLSYTTHWGEHLIDLQRYLFEIMKYNKIR